MAVREDQCGTCIRKNEPVHGEKPLTGMQRLHKKGPRQRQLRKVR